MGGVDLLDSTSRLQVFYSWEEMVWALLVNAINIAVVFSWRVYQLATDNESKQKDYRRTLATIMLKQSQPRLSADSRPGPSVSVPEAVRTDNRNHYPENCPVRRYAVCKKELQNSVYKMQEVIAFECVFPEVSRKIVGCIVSIDHFSFKGYIVLCQKHLHTIFFFLYVTRTRNVGIMFHENHVNKKFDLFQIQKH